MARVKSAQPPYIAQQLISIILPNAIKDEILGDLEEDFHAHFAQYSNNRQAQYNYCKQAAISVVQFLFIRAKDSIASSNIKQNISLIVGFSVFFISLLLISWLSHLDASLNFSQSMMDELVQGNPHKALLHPQFWQISLSSIKLVNSLDYYFQFEAFIWAVISIIVIHLIKQKNSINKTLMMLVSSLMIFLPYIAGSIFLEFGNYKHPQVGVVLAEMIFSVFYLILPITYLTYINLSGYKNQLRK
jgi:heme A synthase